MGNKLLTVGNPKTAKSLDHGYLTAVLHLAPFKASGFNVCAFAEMAGCWKGCLNVAGRGGMSKGNATFDANGIELPDNDIQRCRIRRTRLYFEDRAEFFRQLVESIEWVCKKAAELDVEPVIRLNGTSDIPWEKIRFEHGGREVTIFEVFPAVQFYDYTKVWKRLQPGYALPDNYHLSLSYSEASPVYQAACMNAYRNGAALVVVARDESSKAEIAERFGAAEWVDGDEHDLRFLDPRGALVLLKAKGKARHDSSGFVVDAERQPLQAAA